MANTRLSRSLLLTPQRRSFSTSWAIVAILVATGGIAAGGWVGLQLMINPQSLLWVNQFLPGWIPRPAMGLRPPQTMEQIRQELQRAGQFPGETLALGQNVSITETQKSQKTGGQALVSDWLLPILTTQPNCQIDCDRIVELRVYQTGQLATPLSTRKYQLVTQLAITAPAETSVVAPFIKANTANPGSARSLPLTGIKPLEGNPSSKGWWQLSGETLWDGHRLTYGQIIRYNADQFYLTPMVSWSTPSGQEPIWQQVTGSATPELVVNQTVGLEPQFQIYRLKSTAFVPNPLQLQPILLLQPAIANSVYVNGLSLARNRLWSLASQWLQSYRQSHPKTWTTEAQAQFDLIRWHARLTRCQAEQTWASPGQEALANLIDGRWNRALQRLKTSDAYRRETWSLLRADTGQIQQRMETVLRLNPADVGAKTWQTLLVTAKQNPAAAIAWAQRQPKTSAADLAQIQGWIAQLNRPLTDDLVQSVGDLPPGGQLIGTATLLRQITTSDWLKPKTNPSLKREPAQSWYRVQVMGFQDGRRWRFASSGLGLPSRLTGDDLWKQLGLVTDPLLQLIVWTPDGAQRILNGSIQAARLVGNRLELLAAGDLLPKKLASRPLLALTDSALQWMNPEPIALSDQVQQPGWAEQAIPALVEALQTAGMVASEQALTWEDLESLGLGNWPVQVVPLTGKRPAEVVLTITPELLHGLKEKRPFSQSLRPRTLIFSKTGTLLYSEFSRDAANQYVAIAELGEGLPALLLKTGQNYSLRRWSTKRQRFE